VNAEAITTLLRERVATLARALRGAGSTTIGEWCGMPHRQEVRAIGGNRTAFFTYPLDVLMLRSDALNTPGTAIVQEYRPNHLTHDAEGNEEPVSYAAGEPPALTLSNVFSADGEPIDWTVFAHMPVSDGARLVNTITCAELAAMVVRDAERLVSSTADEIDRAARFYVEPHVLGAALSSERLRSLVWSWPFSVHVGDGPNVCEAAAISHAALWFSATARDAEGLGLNRDVGEPDGRSWMQDVQRWHVQSPRITSTTERGETMRALPGMVGTWPLDDAGPTLDLSHPEKHLGAFSRYVRGCSHVGLGLLYVARREALAELEASHEAAAMFALELVRGLGSDAAWYRSIRRRVAIDALEREGADKSDATAIEALAESLRVTTGDLADTLPPITASALEDGIPRWDARTATFAESLGAAGVEWAGQVRAKGADRVQSGKLWELWADPSYSPPGCRAARGLARVLWRERVAPQLERERTARPFALSTVSHAGDRYAKAPKILAPISWAMGAPGMRAVKMDGDTYAPEPGVAAKLIPRSFALLAELVPDHARKPHQTALAVGYHEEPIALAVAVTGATSYAISPIAAKLALVMLASDNVRQGRLQRVGLGRLATWVHPTAKRIQPRELQATSRALDELRGVFVFLPDGRKAQVFDAVSAATPELARADMEIAWGLTSTFAAVLGTDVTGPKLTGAEYRGDFLVNLDGAMRIPAKRPSLLRHYIRGAAHWNAAFKPGSRGVFDPSRLPTYTAAAWATLTNSLPPGVVEYLRAAGKAGRAATSTHRAAWSKERAAMMDDLAELEAMGLVVVEHKGQDGFRLLPPAVFLEAKNEAMKNGPRPDRGGDE
jgi:hypothetical protein